MPRRTCAVSPHDHDRVHATTVADFCAFEEGDYWSDGSTRSPLFPSPLRFSSLPPLGTEEDKLRGLDLNFFDEEEEEEGPHSDAELSSPRSPSLPS